MHVSNVINDKSSTSFSTRKAATDLDSLVRKDRSAAAESDPVCLDPVCPSSVFTKGHARHPVSVRLSSVFAKGHARHSVTVCPSSDFTKGHARHPVNCPSVVCFHQGARDARHPITVRLSFVFARGHARLPYLCVRRLSSPVAVRPSSVFTKGHARHPVTVRPSSGTPNPGDEQHKC